MKKLELHKDALKTLTSAESRLIGGGGDTDLCITVPPGCPPETYNCSLACPTVSCPTNGCPTMDSGCGS